MSSTTTSYTPVVVVETANMPEQEWLDYRRKGIGGSDAAAILGLSPFCTARDIYYDKLNIAPAIEDESNWVAKEVGHCLEDLVAKIFSFKTGYRVYPVKKMFSHPLYPFMIADVDFFVQMPDGTIALLECKTTNHNAAIKWKDGAIPVNYEIQTRHYMAVMNITKAFIACLHGNNENEFVYAVIDRDPDYEADLIAQEKYFWEENVQMRVEPPYTERGELVLESIRRHYGEGDTTTPAVTLDRKHAAAIERYLSLRQEKIELENKAKQVDNTLKSLYAPIVDELGESCTGICRSGTDTYNLTYKPISKTGINKDNLERLKLNHPELYDEYVQTTVSRRFSVKKGAS